MLETYLQDLAEVVNLDCGSANCEGVTKVANIMKRHFDSIGFATELVDLGPKAGKGLFATNKPGAEKFDIMFNAHLDTVFPDGTAAARPFKVEDGKVTGPGCADCKAGVIAIFHALKNARKEDLDRLAIAVCYNPDEEISSLSSRKWLQQMASKCKRAIVCEPGRATGAFVRSRKGRSVWNVVVHGVAAHAGNNPQDGRSAVLAAAHLTIAITNLQDLEGKGTSVTVGVIEGGTVCNTVPEKCTLKIDTRCWNDEDGREIDEGIEALAKQNWGDGITVEATRVPSRRPCPARTPPRNSLKWSIVLPRKKATKPLGSMPAAAPTPTASLRSACPSLTAWLLPVPVSIPNANTCAWTRSKTAFVRLAAFCNISNKKAGRLI